MGWGTEAVAELRRRFPNRRIVVSGIEADPNATAFWRKLVERGFIECEGLEEAERWVEINESAQTSILREGWEKPAEATAEARALMAQFQHSLAHSD